MEFTINPFDDTPNPGLPGHNRTPQPGDKKFDDAVKSFVAGNRADADDKRVAKLMKRLASLWSKYDSRMKRELQKANVTEDQRVHMARSHVLAMLMTVIEQGEVLYGGFPNLMSAYTGARAFLAATAKAEKKKKEES